MPEELRHPVDFGENDEPILGVVEKERGLGEPVAVVTVFEIEGVTRPADLQRQRDLADLPRPDQCHGSPAVQ